MSDYKEFVFGNAKIGICQLELVNISGFLNRQDLETSLLSIKNNRLLDHIFLNGVDLSINESVIVAPDKKTREILRYALQAKFDNSFCKFPRIILRKTDLIPGLQKVLGYQGE